MKSIPNYEGKYSITEDGEVFSHPKKYGFGWHKERIMKLSEQNGYLAVRLGRGNVNFKYVHQLVALTFLEKIEGKDFVNHKDGNKKNNHYSNLEWCTNSENVLHMFRTGLSKLKCLSDEQIYEIRLLRKNKIKYKEIALKFNISRECASNIVNKKGRFRKSNLFNKDIYNDTGSTSET
jgi:hypothetical protein